MNSFFDTAVTGVSLAAILVLLLGFVIFIQDRKKNTAVFFLHLSIAFFGWYAASVLYQVQAFPAYDDTILFLMYASNMLVPLALVYFAHSLTRNTSFFSVTRMILAAVPYILMLALLYMMQDQFVTPVYEYSGNVRPIEYHVLYILFQVYLAVMCAYALWVLMKKYAKTAGVFKSYVKNILLSLAIPFVVILVVNVALPFYYGIESYLLFGHVASFIGMAVMALMIVRYNVWHTKLILTELFVGIIAIATFAQMILFEKSLLSMGIDAVILFALIFSGHFLIKNVANEVRSKQEVEELAKELSEKNEKLLLLDKRKSEFVSMSSHLLRDPITAIKGYASMLLEGSFGSDIGKDAHEAISKIYESSERLVAIIGDFMDIQNIESGEMDYVFELFDMGELVNSVIEESQHSIRRSGLSLDFEYDKNKSYMARIDVGKMRQVISNLLDNALKYTPKGSVKIKLDRNEMRKTIRLDVSDSGIGLSPETIQRLFQKFSRAEGVSKLHTDGSGLGLFVAREILKEHKGRIWVTSSGEGKGSTFSIELRMPD